MTMKNLHIKLIILITIFVLSGCRTSMTNFDGDVIEVLTDGEWSWVSEEDSCAKAVQVIEFNESQTLMTMHWEDRSGENQGVVYKYNIQEINGSNIKADMIGEERKNKSNELVSWNLVVKSPELYCWNRTDWPMTSCTNDMYKCKSKTTNQ